MEVCEKICFTKWIVMWKFTQSSEDSEDSEVSSLYAHHIWAEGSWQKKKTLILPVVLKEKF